jgi:hypothetical protein
MNPTEPYLIYFLDVYKRIVELKYRVAGRSYTPSKFTDLIRRQFDAVTFIVKTERDPAVDPDQVIVAGLYDCYDDAEMLPSITITLCYHPEQETYFVDLINWNQFAFDLAECVGHEMVHMHQYKIGRAPALREYQNPTNTEPTLDQKYLGDESEIEAYGFSIAAEMFMFKKSIQDCVMYFVYQQTFETDTKIVLQLEQQVEQYFKTLEQLYEQTN